MNNIGILITVIVVAAVFGYLWYTGQLVRIRKYWDEVWIDVRDKCSWPTWNELKGSTIVVFISILILGGFTMLVDAIMVWCVHHLS